MYVGYNMVIFLQNNPKKKIYINLIKNWKIVSDAKKTFNSIDQFHLLYKSIKKLFNMYI